MKARGKREAKRARCPWLNSQELRLVLKGRNTAAYISALQASNTFVYVTRGDVLRFAPHLPLAFIFRASGAAQLKRTFKPTRLGIDLFDLAQISEAA